MPSGLCAFKGDVLRSRRDRRDRTAARVFAEVGYRTSEKDRHCLPRNVRCSCGKSRALLWPHVPDISCFTRRHTPPHHLARVGGGGGSTQHLLSPWPGASRTPRAPHCVTHPLLIHQRPFVTGTVLGTCTVLSPRVTWLCGRYTPPTHAPAGVEGPPHHRPPPWPRQPSAPCPTLPPHPLLLIHYSTNTENSSGRTKDA